MFVTPSERGRRAASAPILRERLRDGLSPCPSVRAIQASYGYSKREILSPSRAPELVACRVEIAALMYARGLRLREIAERMGRRHHSTVFHWLDIWGAVMAERRD